MWAAAFPFFLLPGPLTIESPDIYGGFGVHIRMAAVLATAGGVACLARVYLGPRLRSDGKPARWVASLDTLLALLIVAGLTAVVTGIAAWCAASAAPLLGSSGTVGPGARPVSVPLLALPGAFAVLARAGLDGRELAPLRLLACAAWLALLLALLAATTPPGPLAPPGAVALLVACGLLALSWGRLGTGPASLWTALAALPFGLAGATAGASVVLQPGEWLDRAGAGPHGPSALAFAADASGFMVVGCVAWQLAWRVAGADLRGPRWALPWAALSHAALAALLHMAALATARHALCAAESWSFLLMPVQEAMGGPGGGRGVPGFAVAAWVLALVSGGLQADSGLAMRRWLGGSSLLWCAIGLGLLLRMILPGTAGTLAPLVGLAGLAAALCWPALLRSERAAFDLGLATLAVFAGPLVARPLLTVVLAAPGPVAAILLGGLLGLALAVTLALGGRRRQAGRRASARIGPTARTAGLLAASVVGVMPIYAGIALAVRPAAVASAALLIACGAAAIALAVRRRPGASPLAVGAVATWLCWYACTAVLWHFKSGPGAAECGDVLARGGAAALLDRFGEGGDYASVQPYDVLPVPQQGVLLATFKRIDARAGFVELLDLAFPGRRERLETVNPRTGKPQWPERMEYDPARGSAVTQLLGTEDYALWDLRIGPPAAMDGKRLSVAATLPLRWEPGNPALDLVRRRMVVTYVPNRTADNPLLEVFDLDRWTSLGQAGRPPGRLEMADFAATGQVSGRFYVPAMYDSMRFVLAEFDGSPARLARQVETGAPSIGLAVDEARGKLYLTSALGSRVLVLDLADLAVVQVVRSGRFPRDVVFDRERSRLYAGGYADGVVTAFDVGEGGLAPVFSVEVGSLLRGLGLDAASGRVYAASGCGVFEVAGEGGAPPVRAPSGTRPP